MPIETVCEELTGLVTSKYLEKLFKRGSLTILHWRQHRGLPFVLIRGDERPTIRFRLEKVLEWAKAKAKRTYPVVEEEAASPPASDDSSA